MIEDVMGYGYVVEEKQQLDLNDPIVDPEQQAHNPTHEQYKRQETNQADSFVPDLPQSKLIPIGLNLKPIESAMEIKYMPLTKPIWKKDRILWTPELHARFVASLHVLGGPEAAKPKQITASMQVAGLTTDQVKSHLQRYRQIWRSEREGLQ